MNWHNFDRRNENRIFSIPTETIEQNETDSIEINDCPEIISNNRIYCCSICDINFSGPKSLQKHLRKHFTSENPSSFACEQLRPEGNETEGENHNL
ncbi:unnamed protein product [Blepharisma stoltei]|uniref:C2H2-type domain-containing protein n=1 Tax=Blepharisma stoltei TaxID=1481888 RepID=A0AAU9JYT5_9CILI|nr:unnamed protein product [Blepharisma stoltei]